MTDSAVDIEGNMKAPEKVWAIAINLLEEKEMIYIKRGPYVYKGGVWEQVEDIAIEAWIHYAWIKGFRSPPTSHNIKEIVGSLKIATFNQYGDLPYAEKPTNKINLKSGIFDIETGSIKPYEKEDFIFQKLPFDYKDKIEGSKMLKFSKFLTTSMNYNWDPNKKGPIDPDKEFIKRVQFVQEWIGYSFLSGNPFEKALIMIGEGQNGKGVLQHIWTSLVGRHNVSAIPLDRLEDKTEISGAKDRLVNFSYDLSGNVQLDTGCIKIASEGGTVRASDKFEQPYDFVFTAKIVIACNELPYTKNMGRSITRRFFILPFEREFEEHERDTTLKTCIINSELDMIFSWAICGLRRLLKRGSFDTPAICEQAIYDYKMESDTVALWIEEDEAIKVDHSIKTKSSIVYKAYKDFCYESGVRTMGRTRFYKAMRKRNMHHARSKGGYWFLSGIDVINAIGEHKIKKEQTRGEIQDKPF